MVIIGLKWNFLNIFTVDHNVTYNAILKLLKNCLSDRQIQNIRNTIIMRTLKYNDKFCETMM